MESDNAAFAAPSFGAVLSRWQDHDATTAKYVRSARRRLQQIIAHLLPPMPTVLKPAMTVPNESPENMQIIPFPGTQEFEKWQQIMNPRDKFAASTVLLLNVGMV